MSRVFLARNWIWSKSASVSSAPMDSSAMRLICSVLFLGKSSFSKACSVKFSRVPKLRTKRA